MPSPDKFRCRDPEIYKQLHEPPVSGYVRILGLDLGTNCGIAFCDVPVDRTKPLPPMVGGIWDLSIGPYDGGPIRHIRLKQFLEIAQPSLVMYEDVKFTPAADLFKNKAGGLQAIISRVSTPAEFLGGLKVTVTTWCAERGLPSEGIGISQIKQFATGRGNAGKADMIRSCNTKFGTELDPETYEKNGDDNIADAAFVCAMGVEWYGRGVTGG